MVPSLGCRSVCNLQGIEILGRIVPTSGVLKISTSPKSFDMQRMCRENKSNSLAAITFILLVALAYTPPAKAQAPSAKANEFGKVIRPILQEYCYDCHGQKKTKGKVKLTDYGSWADLEKNLELIEKMIEALAVSYTHLTLPTIYSV